MSRRTALPVAALTALLLTAGCGGDDEAASTTTTAAVATTTTAPAATTSTTSADDGATTTTEAGGSDATTVPPEGNDPMDYEGQRYDFGLLSDVVRRDGVVMLSFDRVQLYTDDGGLESGPQLTAEPIIYGNTDVPYINDATKLRTFVLADQPEVLRIADPIPCASDEDPADPTWTSISVDALVGGAWEDRVMASLTFGDDGLVSRLRLSAAC